MAFPTLANPNIESSCKDLWKTTVRDQVAMSNPLMAKLIMERRMTWKGGKSITQTMVKDDLTDLVQNYVAGDPLESKRKTFLTNAYFKWKNKSIPVVVTMEEMLDNMGGSDTAPIDFSKTLVKVAHRAMRYSLRNDAYGAGGIGSDDGTTFQSIRQALDHDATYAHLSRADTTTNAWFQGASLDGTYTDQDTARNFSIDTFDQARDAIYRKETDGPRNLICIVGEAGYRALRRYVRAKRIDTSRGPLAKYGFLSFMIDDVEVVRDPYLLDGNLTDSQKWFFLLDVNTWEFRVHPKRSFLFTPFTWQAQFTNGADEELARIFLRGNLCCWQPGANIWLSNCS